MLYNQTEERAIVKDTFLWIVIDSHICIFLYIDNFAGYSLKGRKGLFLSGGNFCEFSVQPRFQKGTGERKTGRHHREVDRSACSGTLVRIPALR